MARPGPAHGLTLGRARKRNCGKPKDVYFVWGRAEALLGRSGPVRSTRALRSTSGATRRQEGERDEGAETGWEPHGPSTLRVKPPSLKGHFGRTAARANGQRKNASSREFTYIVSIKSCALVLVSSGKEL